MTKMISEKDLLKIEGMRDCGCVNCSVSACDVWFGPISDLVASYRRIATAQPSVGIALIELFTLLEDATKTGGGWSLNRNDHHLEHAAVEEYAREIDPTWESDESERRAYAADSLFVLRWYPSNQIGFYMLAAPDIGGLLRMVNSVLSTYR